jgi:hypothetical protein
MKKVTPLILVMLTLSACAINTPVGEPMSKSNLTAGQVSLTLKKDITTQTEVVETFGAPNVVTNSSDGTEVWTYQSTLPLLMLVQILHTQQSSWLVVKVRIQVLSNPVEQ